MTFRTLYCEELYALNAFVSSQITLAATLSLKRHVDQPWNKDVSLTNEHIINAYALFKLAHSPSQREMAHSSALQLPWINDKYQWFNIENHFSLWAHDPFYSSWLYTWCRDSCPINVCIPNQSWNLSKNEERRASLAADVMFALCDLTELYSITDAARSM